MSGKKKITARVVAEAICSASERAGQDLSVTDPQSVKQRVENLLSDRHYCGPYIEEGDPKGWCAGALATIYMEQQGGDFDCELPLEYWEDGMEVSLKASELLPGRAFIEFVNAAVAVVVE